MLVQSHTQELFWESIPSPIGECVVLATRDGVCWVGTPGSTAAEGFAKVRRWFPFEQVTRDRHAAALPLALDELQRYFAGERIQFSCPLDIHGTPFQVRVWQELCRIPFGETRSYGEIARAIGYPRASRAVGAANGANPIAIIIPCHRVIGSNRTLTGYGGGLSTKAWLLTLEGCTFHGKPGWLAPALCKGDEK